MNQRIALALLFSAGAMIQSGPAASQSAQPGQPASGAIRIWGQPQMQEVVQKWEAGFRKSHPDARFETHLTGSDIGFAALYSSAADIALMGREPGPDNESKAFEWIFQYKALPIKIMTGSLAKSGKSPALVVFVHKDNPLAKLDLSQLDAIIGHERLRGAPQTIADWGQLGLGWEWAKHPINIYAYDSEAGTGKYFRQVVLKDSRNLNWDRLTEFKDQKKADGTIDRSGRQILAALAKDRYGIAVANLEFLNPAVKPVALVAADGSVSKPSAENIIARSYPLTRAAYAYINRKPDSPIDPKVKEFLLYILSDEGQNAVRENGQYLPLNQKIVREQLAKLK